MSCPLANSSYATVRSHPSKEVNYLYIKTIERCHLPSKMWEKIKLSGNYQQALAQIDERLKYMPQWLIHKCKQCVENLSSVLVVRYTNQEILDASLA
jgi:protein MAK16